MSGMPLAKIVAVQDRTIARNPQHGQGRRAVPIPDS